jgi:chemotaxis protein methyltransferase CheR
VLIYFDRETKAQVLNRLAKTLAPDGVLFLGAAETILGLDTVFEPISGLRGAYGLPQANKNGMGGTAIG